MLDLSVLNDEQLPPVLCTEGAVLVAAGAGSGKTRLLTYRIANLIINQNVPAYNILAITFTNKAAREMQHRLEKMIPNEDQIFISTFHSMCVRILRRYIDKIGYSKNFSIYDESERKKVLKQVAIATDKDNENLPEAIGLGLSRIKNAGNDIEWYADNYKYLPNIDDIVRGMYKYEQEMQERNALDFDDLLTVAYSLLAQSKEARDHYQQRFRYIHVDEFQDTNVIQYKLINILSGVHGNIFVVGDEDQSIYGWRGANIANIKNFINDYKDCNVFKLEQNYRSTKNILQLANSVIKNNESRTEKKLWTENDEGLMPQLHVAKSDGEEADFVMQTVKGLRAGGSSYNNMAVLMRVNALSRAIEQKFMFYGVPYKLYGGFKFYDRREIKDILAYLKLIDNPRDNEAAMRVISFPKKGIGDTSLEKMLNLGKEFGRSLYGIIFSVIGNGDMDKAIMAQLGAALASKLKLLAQQIMLIEENRDAKVSIQLKFIYNLLRLNDIFSSGSEDDENRKFNLRELINSVMQTEEQNPKMTLSDYLQQIMLYSDLDSEPEGEAVSLFTVHSAKGLEFDTVFIIGAEDGIFPLSRSMDSPAELEEERRLMYVALTRAKKRLFISHTRTRFMYGQYKVSLPSRFLFESGLLKASKREESLSSPKRSMFSPITQNLPTTNIDISKLSDGIKIMHKRMGKGIIKSVNSAARQIDVEFESVGTITLSVDFAPITIIS